MTRQRFINLLHVASVVLVPLACWPNGRSFQVMLAKEVLLYTIGFLALALWISGGFCVTHEERCARENQFLILYILFLFLSIAVAKKPRVAIFGSAERRDGVLMFLNYVAVYFLARQATIDEGIVLRGLCVSASLISLLAILQSYQIDPPILRLYAQDWKGLAFSVLGNPNFLGSFLVLIIPLGPYFFMEKNKMWGMIVYSLAFLALLATRTRGSWIGGALALIVYFFLSRERMSAIRIFHRKWLALLLVTTLLFVFFLVTATYDVEGRLFSLFVDAKKVLSADERADEAGSSRVYIWKKVMGLIMKKPLLGYGVENLSYAMEDAYYEEIVRDYGEYRNWDKAHNEFLHIAVSSGIPSLLVYISFLATSLKKGFVARHHSPYHSFLLASLVGYLTQAMFNIQMILVYYLFLAFVGYVSRPSFLREDKEGANGV